MMDLDIWHALMTIKPLGFDRGHASRTRHVVLRMDEDCEGYINIAKFVTNSSLQFEVVEQIALQYDMKEFSVSAMGQVRFGSHSWPVG